MTQPIPVDFETNIKEDFSTTMPVYPEPLLDANSQYDIPSYEGDVNDLLERRNTKLFNLWTIWSDLRKNEELVKMLEAKKADDKVKKYLKAILTITMDRMGKVLADTNIMEELCIKKSVLEEGDKEAFLREIEMKTKPMV